MQNNNIYYVKEQVVVFTGYNQTEIQCFDHKSRNCAVLDTGCIGTVCGQVVAI